MELYITPSRVANIFLHHRPPNINAHNNHNNLKQKKVLQDDDEDQIVSEVAGCVITV